MKLVDKDTRRWYCKKDEMTFIASEGGWIERSAAGALGSRQPKSQLLAMVINLFPGGGVLYAGQTVGAIYPVLAVICIFVFPPGLLLIMLASFLHTYVAIKECNRTGQLRGPLSTGNAAPLENSPGRDQLDSGRDPIPFDFAEKDHSSLRTCGKCGRGLRDRGNFCPGCGTEIFKSPSSDSDRTRLFA